MKNVPAFVIGLATAACFLGSSGCFAQETADQVAATVGDEKIFVSQIDQEFQRKFSDREVNDELKAGLRSQILQRLINQQLVLAKFSGTDILATDDEVDLELSRLRERLQRIEKTLEEFLKEHNQSIAGLRFDLRWQISWKRYLDQTLTDKVLEKYFERHRRQFDGTRIKAAHILWKVPDEDSDSIQSVTEEANAIRRQIINGSISWDNAAATHSTAPSAKNSGNVGWINFEGPMSRNFTQAAFELDRDELSQPIETPFGIHLIKCLDIQQGTIPWYEATENIRRAATQELFERISQKQKAETEVRITGAIPNATTDESDARDR